VDVSLLPDQVYERVFAQTAGQHGILDLLGITRTGRLAILELKTTVLVVARRSVPLASSARGRELFYRVSGILIEPNSCLL
jgi:hypothetical protein